MRLIATAATILAALSSSANAAPFMCTLKAAYSCDDKDGCKAEEGRSGKHYWIIDPAAKTMTFCDTEGTKCAEHAIEIEYGDIQSPTLSRIGSYSFDEQGRVMAIASAGSGLGAAFSHSEFFGCVAMPTGSTERKKLGPAQ
ncbi:hypothetical protein GHJ84_08800 [Sinorhizobium meliloti]|uniref:hypothetical protein n=1 Tax=Rhizobium meliloti TaxID=382 RepID=UPI0012957E30|nr:hypothetical protein [Sinorhizobium meliloti]MQX21094.1 hypothetical protein [Sinorhizobium meliloti]